MIDRVVLGVHVGATGGGRRLGERHGLARAGSLVELRLALPVRAVSAPGFAAVARYMPEAERHRELAIQVDQETLGVDADEAITVTAKGQAYLDDLFGLHARVASRSWKAQAASLPALAAASGRLLAAATATGGDAFGNQAPPYEPPGAPVALLLFNRLAALRYHRADAHEAAWAAAGYTAVSIAALEDGAPRAAVEAETNRLAATPFAALSDREQATFLAGLAALAG